MESDLVDHRSAWRERETDNFLSRASIRVNKIHVHKVPPQLSRLLSIVECTYTYVQKFQVRRRTHCNSA